MTTTACDDQFTAEPEPVIQPYDTGSILRRNVADLELALKQQAERAEAAEAELARLREQEPLTWVTSGELMDILKNPIYSSPAPVPAVAAPLTAQADCRACANRGRINGLSQESFCDSCVWQGMSFRKNHYAPNSPEIGGIKIDAATDRLLEGGK